MLNTSLVEALHMIVCVCSYDIVFVCLCVLEIGADCGGCSKEEGDET